MTFIKYSVVELGIEEDVPGWVKKAKDSRQASSEEPIEDSELAHANKKAEDQEESSIKDQ